MFFCNKLSFVKGLVVILCVKLVRRPHSVVTQLNSCRYTASVSRLCSVEWWDAEWIMTCGGYGRKCSSLYFRYSLGICMNVMERNYEKSQNSRYPPWDLYPGRDEYEAGLPVPRVECSVFRRVWKIAESDLVSSCLFVRPSVFCIFREDTLDGFY